MNKMDKWCLKPKVRQLLGWIRTIDGTLLVRVVPLYAPLYSMVDFKIGGQKHTPTPKSMWSDVFDVKFAKMPKTTFV